MDVFIGADHRGWELKRQLVDWLRRKGHLVHDVGAEKKEPDDDYPTYAFKVAEAVAAQEGRGIVICGSGAGMAVAATKVPGIRAALIHEATLARAARRDDNINILALGADFIAADAAETVVQAFLETVFDPAERHTRRLQQIEQYP